MKTINIYKKLRKEKNLSQLELANILNITQTAISKWENGIYIPDTMTLKKIAELFNISIEELLNNNEQIKINGNNNFSNNSFNNSFNNEIKKNSLKLDNLEKLNKEEYLILQDLINYMTKNKE